MKLLLHILLVLSSISLARSQDSSDIARTFVGKIYGATRTIVPKGFEAWGGGLIDKTPFWTTEFYNFKSKKLILILKTEVGREGKQPRWKILDAIITDLDTSNFDRWNYDNIASCTDSNGQITNVILVITNRSRGSVRDAWRIDSTEARIQRLRSRALKCTIFPPED